MMKSQFMGALFTRTRKERERARVISLEARVTPTMTVGCEADAIVKVGASQKGRQARRRCRDTHAAR